MSRVLDKRAGEIVLAQLEDNGVITTDALVELLNPHYNFDPRKAREREVRKKANSMMARYRDAKGIRTCFNYKSDEGESRYINVDKSSDIEALEGVERQLDKKYWGLNESKKKVRKRRLELSGQMTIEL